MSAPRIPLRRDPALDLRAVVLESGVKMGFLRLDRLNLFDLAEDVVRQVL